MNAGGLVSDTAEPQIGDRIRRYRGETALSLSQLAERAGISKSYLWNLENHPQDKRPSAKTLYALAQVLGVTIADLLGTELVATEEIEVEEALADFAREDKLPKSDVTMLASIQWRGERPRSVERWRYIYQAIKTSRSLDE